MALGSVNHDVLKVPKAKHMSEEIAHGIQIGVSVTYKGTFRSGFLSPRWGGSVSRDRKHMTDNRDGELVFPRLGPLALQSMASAFIIVYTRQGFVVAADRRRTLFDGSFVD